MKKRCLFAENIRNNEHMDDSLHLIFQVLKNVTDILKDDDRLEFSRPFAKEFDAMLGDVSQFSPIIFCFLEKY